MRRGVVAIVLALGTGCFGREATPFPAGLAPLEENLAPSPEGDVEAVEILTGVADEFNWAHARGVVHAPIADVWAALRDPDADVDRRRVDEWTTEAVADADADFAYAIHHVVHDIVTVDYVVTWRHGAVEGAVDAPEVVGARWQKTYGSSLIALLRGSAVLRADGRERTEIELIQHLGAATTTPEAVGLYLQDVYTDVVALSHGESLPTY